MKRYDVWGFTSMEREDGEWMRADEVLPRIAELEAMRAGEWKPPARKDRPDNFRCLFWGDFDWRICIWWRDSTNPGAGYWVTDEEFMTLPLDEDATTFHPLPERPTDGR